MARNGVVVAVVALLAITGYATAATVILPSPNKCGFDPLSIICNGNQKGVNLAYKKPVTYTPEYDAGYEGELATDGKFGGNLGIPNQCYYSDSNYDYPYLSVDLGSPQNVDKILIRNSDNLGSDWLNGARVYIGSSGGDNARYDDTSCAVFLNTTYLENYVEVVCDAPTMGQFVTITRTSFNIIDYIAQIKSMVLVVCEVVVMGPGSECYDLNTDDMNCGACGNACPADSNCFNGVCKASQPSLGCPNRAYFRGGRVADVSLLYRSDRVRFTYDVSSTTRSVQNVAKINLDLGKTIKRADVLRWSIASKASFTAPAISGGSGRPLWAWEFTNPKAPAKAFTFWIEIKKGKGVSTGSLNLISKNGLKNSQQICVPGK